MHDPPRLYGDGMIGHAHYIMYADTLSTNDKNVPIPTELLTVRASAYFYISRLEKRTERKIKSSDIAVLQQRQKRYLRTVCGKSEIEERIK